MANVKITELTATTDPVSTDVLPIVDVGADTTKKVTIADLLENAGNGSAGAPAFAFDSDPDTGMYRAGTNLLGFATVGVGRVFIADNGDFGHGTTNPSGKIHVESPSGAGWQFRTDTTGLSNESGFFRDSSNHIELVLRNAASGLAFLKNAGGSSNPHLLFHIGTTEKLRIDSSGNTLLGGSTSPASATSSLAIFNGTAPTGSVANGVVLYAEDVSSSSELKVRDEAGNVTTLSPHNFDLIPEGPSEDMAWSYYSERDGKRINVDMLKAVRLLEQLSGEKLVFTS